jgi:hypothetical protein
MVGTLAERPFTQEIKFWTESVNTDILVGCFSTEVRFLTRLVTMMADTDIASNLSVRGEIAF